MSDYSPSELYAIQLNNNDPGYYGRTPGIVFHCTYVCTENNKKKKTFGKSVRKKLSPYAITLYTLIKLIAGKEGKVWMTGANLAEQCGFSESKLSEAKKELTQPMEQLNGKPLIEITKRKVKFKRKDGTEGARDADVLTPTHIWPENNAYMSTLKHHQSKDLGILEESSSDESSSQCELDQRSSSHCELDPLGSSSHCEGNNRTENKIPSVLETDTPAGPAVCSLEKENNSVLPDAEKIIRKTEEMKELLRNIGADDNFIKELLRNYSLSQIHKAGMYVQAQKKKKPIPNFCAYLRKSLENKYYESNR